MNRTKPKSGRVFGSIPYETESLRVSRSRDKKTRIYTVKPGPLPLSCPLQTPNVNWSDSKKVAPTGRIVSAIFGDCGWMTGELRPEISRMLENVGIRSLAYSLCGLIACNACDAKTECNNTQYESVCTQRVETGEESMVTIRSNPLYQNIKSCYTLWHGIANPHLRRVIVILATLGKMGMRPGGYYRNDVARMAGIRPGNYNASNRLVAILCHWGYLRRQKRRGRTPRFRYDPDGSAVRLQEAHSETMRRFVREKLVIPLDAMTKSRKPFREYNEYAPIVNGILVGDQSSAAATEVFDRMSIIAFETLYRGLVEPAIQASIWGDNSHTRDAEEVKATLYKQIDDLLEHCRGCDKREAAEMISLGSPYIMAVDLSALVDECRVGANARSLLENGRGVRA